MKINFDWKVIMEIKPEFNKTIIIKIEAKEKPKLFIGTMISINEDKMFVFNGGKLNLESLSKKNTETLLINTNSTYTWDYYSKEWI